MMFSKFAFFAGILSLASAVSAADSDSTFALFAYGTDVYGRVYFSDGTGYIANITENDHVGYKNFTEAVDNSKIWIGVDTDNSTSTNSTELPVLYIYPAAGLFQPVGLAPNTSIPDGASYSGWTWYGRTAMFLNSTSSALESKFWATTTNETGIWELVWNVDGTAHDNAVPVTLKNHAARGYKQKM